MSTLKEWVCDQSTWDNWVDWSPDLYPRHHSDTYRRQLFEFIDDEYNEHGPARFIDTNSRVSSIAARWPVPSDGYDLLDHFNQGCGPLPKWLETILAKDERLNA